VYLSPPARGGDTIFLGFGSSVVADGTFSVSHILPCEANPGNGVLVKITFLQVEARTAEDKEVYEDFPPPSGC
jgi:hypothetical protein